MVVYLWFDTIVLIAVSSQLKEIFVDSVYVLSSFSHSEYTFKKQNKKFAQGNWGWRRGFVLSL